MITTICDYTTMGDDFAKLDLTTEHPASNYNQPVLVDNTGNVYGRDDIVSTTSGRNGGRGTTAYQFVLHAARMDAALMRDELVQRFLRQ